MAYNYKIAKEVLSDKDKERIVCIHLNRTADGKIDWDKAAAEFDCASAASMQVMTRSTLKKITDAGGKMGEGDATVAATPKKTGARKRKADTTQVNGDDEHGDAEATAATKKAKGRGKKAKGVKEEQVSEEPASGGEA
ncbi:hypothetical protein Q7P37_005092 [Cladosporium fusiforme]